MIQIGEQWRLVQISPERWAVEEWDDEKGWCERWDYVGVREPARRLGHYLATHGAGHDLAALRTALGAIHDDIAQAMERAERAQA